MINRLTGHHEILQTLLSLMTTVGSYSENKLFMPLSPIRRNLHEIIINNGPGRATEAD